MKGLSYSSMAAARLRANKRSYVSLVIGIFLAIFLVTTFFLAVQGFLLAQAERTERSVGKLDAFLLDDTELSDEALMDSGLFTEIGHVYVTAMLEKSNTYVGAYDETAKEHMDRSMIDGRLPEAPGEVAVEQGVLLSIDLDREWAVGDGLELALVPIDGVKESRTYTLVGILTDQAAKLDSTNSIQTSEEFVKQFPAVLVDAEEPAFATGRTALHRTFRVEGGKLAAPYVARFYSTVGLNTSFARFFGISMTGYVSNVDELWLSLLTDSGTAVPFVLGILLAVSLMISCCVGIAGAMEGALSRRSEEIGLLRAVGATKRQIRRIFGRESLLLAVLVSPASVLLSIAAVGAFAWMTPEQMILKLDPVLLVPIGLVSIGMIVLSGYLPLRRCANQMPMSVIRDTAVLRRVRHIKSRKQFRVPELISLRLLRLYPSRQVGSGILSSLMLFCAACAAVIISVGGSSMTEEAAAFEIRIPNASSTAYMDMLPNAPLSSQSIAQLKQLPHVTDVVIERNVDVSILLEETCDYLKQDNHAFYTLEEYLAAAQEGWDVPLTQEQRSDVTKSWESVQEEYNEVREFLNVEQELARITIATVVLDEKTLLEYSGYLVDGEIDVEAINAGKEVLVSAPKLWEGVDNQGYTYQYRGPVQLSKRDRVVSENDCFYPGQVLPMIQLYTEAEGYDHGDPYGDALRRDAAVTVGAVLDQLDGPWWSIATIVTTEEGLQNMGLYANGYDTYSIYLDGDIDQQTEELLVRYAEAVAARSGEYFVRNLLENHRESIQTQRQLVLIFIAITLLFTVVAVSMVVSSITRRIQSDGRRIGMLRAVGADEKTILGCYSGQIAVSILGGAVPAVGLFVMAVVSGFFGDLGMYVPHGLGAMAGLGLISWLICRLILRLRIREIVSRSIIDNIREL